jgi:hypothetical protein
MNERIKELAEQAGYDWQWDTQIDFGHKEMEKFAELIIKECLSVTKKQYNDTLPWGGVEDTIKEHFGVEE